MSGIHVSWDWDLFCLYELKYRFAADDFALTLVKKVSCWQNRVRYVNKNLSDSSILVFGSTLVMGTCVLLVYWLLICMLIFSLKFGLAFEQIMGLIFSFTLGLIFELSSVWFLVEPYLWVASQAQASATAGWHKTRGNCCLCPAIATLPGSRGQLCSPQHPSTHCPYVEYSAVLWYLHRNQGKRFSYIHAAVLAQLPRQADVLAQLPRGCCYSAPGILVLFWRPSSLGLSLSIAAFWSIAIVRNRGTHSFHYKKKKKKIGCNLIC